eukprot:2116011-Pleurochrysis_carterae.AAC.2
MRSSGNGLRAAVAGGLRVQRPEIKAVGPYCCGCRRRVEAVHVRQRETERDDIGRERQREMTSDAGDCYKHCHKGLGGKYILKGARNEVEQMPQDGWQELMHTGSVRRNISRQGARLGLKSGCSRVRFVVNLCAERAPR